MWSCKLLGLTVCAVAWRTTGASADEEPEWVQWYQQGESLMVDQFGPLPVEISGKNFTLERLEMYFTPVSFEHRATDAEELVVEQPAIAKPRMSIAARSAVPLVYEGMQIFCSSEVKPVCSSLSQNSQNVAKGFHRLLEVDVVAVGYGWDQMHNWKPERKLPGGVLSFKNSFGVSVVNIWYDWEFYYGGQIANGGAFIRAATPLVKLETGILQSLDVISRTRAKRNAGTVDAPIAAIDIEIEFVSSMGTTACMATIQGDGKSWVHSGCAGKPTAADPDIDPRIPGTSSAIWNSIQGTSPATAAAVILIVFSAFGLVAFGVVRMRKPSKYTARAVAPVTV